ncbi:MAG: cation transporter [Acidobacteria bacterium]|nr:MAG: cation transporter [Acidobacteriota bacterium]
MGLRAEEVHHRQSAVALVAAQTSPPVLGGASPPLLTGAARYRDVSRVLVLVLLLNLLVALAKLAYGFYSGAVSIVSDGFHSLTDTASNVTGLVGVRLAGRPPDTTHPYGHRKFETLASVAIFVFLAIVLVQVLRTALDHLAGGATPEITPAAFVVMAGTIAVNLFVVWYESWSARRLSSELLMADSAHTLSDVYTSVAVLAALIGVKLGYPILDPIAALLVAVFIGRAGYSIAKETSKALADHAVLGEADIRRVVATVPEASGCHEIRTRGTADHIFLDFHLWFPGDMPLDEAHRLSHVVKDKLMDAFPSLRDIVIHIEPDERQAR